MRNLRNALEEVEADYDPTRTLGPDDVRLFNQIGRSHDILSRLDLVLESYKTLAPEEVNMNAVSDLKTALDVTTHQLRLAFEATTTGEIPLKLDTRDFPNHPRASASIEDSSASRSRKSSTWSLAQRDTPRSPGTSDATSFHNDRVDRSITEEKQALQTTESAAADARASMDWRSPFADPLSMSIEEATSFIQAGDDDLSMSAYARPLSRSRAESNVSVATETFVSAPASPDMERKPLAAQADQPRANELQMPSNATVDAPIQVVDTESASTATQTEFQSVHEARAEYSHLSPETATRELALKRVRSGSNASAISDAVIESVPPPAPGMKGDAPPDTVGSEAMTSRPSSSPRRETQDIPSSSVALLSDPSAVDSASLLTTSPPAAQADPIEQSPQLQTGDGERATAQSAPAVGDFVDDLTRTMEAVFAGDRQIPAQTSPLQEPVAGDRTPPQAEEQAAPASPPPPSRRPPPPPPAVKRVKPTVKLRGVQSKYRIVNDAPDESSSDEELYSSSRPSSAPKTKSPSSAQDAAVLTPTIQIDQSALDDVEQREEADAGISHGSSSQPSEHAHLPQTVYKPPNPTKPSIFTGKQSSETASPKHVQAGTPIAKIRPQSPPEQRSTTSSMSTSPQPQSPRSPPLPPSVRKRVGAAVKAGDEVLGKEIETRLQGNSKPPPVPPRPRSRYNRPRAATAISSPAMLSGKEIAVESGLETHDGLLSTKESGHRLLPRVSVDHALSVAAQDSFSTAPEATVHLDGTRHARSASTSQLPPPQLSPQLSRSPVAAGLNGHRMTGWNAPGADETPQNELDGERVYHIVYFWNNMAWNVAEQYLMAYLESLIEQDNMALVRRIRHLLGVCATFKGDFSHAIDMFLSVLDLHEPSDLSKPGNCEACYWLGDLYAMQNQRLEALLAYCAAQWGQLFNDPEEPKLGDLIKAEQEVVQLGSPKSDFKLRWSQEAREGCGTILDPKIMAASVVKHLFEVEPRRKPPYPYSHSRTDKPFQLDPNKPRSSSFFSLSTTTQMARFRRNRIDREHFFHDGPWPLQYDPTFTMANVRRERLLGYECDLLSALQSTTGEAKIPKTGPMSLSRMDCFTCSDLPWLITSVRECLKMLEMEWSEVANEQGVWFVVRHTLMDGPSRSSSAMKIATVHYFAISLFRQSFRSSYGVEICSHGVSSARIMDPSNLDFEKGVHHDEPKRIKKLIREALEAAEKNRPKSKKRQSSIGLGISRSSSDDAPVKTSEESDKPPPVPLRPTKAV